MFKLILVYLKCKGILIDFYNIHSTPLAEIPARIVQVLKISFTKLYSYDVTFFAGLSKCFAVILIIFVFSILFSNKNFKIKLIQLLLVYIAAFASNTALILSQDYQPYFTRIDCYGTAYFRTLIIALCLSSSLSLKNIGIILSCITLWLGALNNAHCFRIWKFSWEAEKMFYNRTLSKIENDKNFDANRKYTLYHIGPTINFKQNFYHLKNKEPDLLFQGESWAQPWGNPFGAIQFYAPHPFIQQTYLTVDGQPTSVYKPLYDMGLLQKAKAYPNPQSLIILNDVILFVTDQQKLDEIIQELDHAQNL